MSAQRVQLHRTKGWRKPEGAVLVSRPSVFGNPFTVSGARQAGYVATEAELRGMCVALFRAWLSDPEREWSGGIAQAHYIRDHVSDLRGRDLACWCPLDQPCHADVLLELANQPAPSIQEPSPR